MKKLTFTVTIEFEDKITQDNEISEVADNIADAIVDAARGFGIAPNDSETYTKAIEVYSEVSKTCARRVVY
jgi:NAD(P)H-hydrate repair Nnr-like enzyme with NAD(P)H-hydrate epimerase domain